MQHAKGFWRGLFFFLLIIALCGGMALPGVSLPARAAPQMQTPAIDIVISEVRFRGSAGAGDEFIELFNPTQATVNLNGWSINRSNDTGATNPHYSFTADVFLQPGQYYLIANNAYDDPAVMADATYGTGINDAGGIALIRPDSSIADEVGLGSNSAYQEGTPLTSLGNNNADRSYERKPGGALHSCQDTNDNSSDFQLRDPSNPQNFSSPLLPCVIITNVTSSVADAVYTTGAVIDIAITFNSVVSVTGSPTLLLETGTTDRTATYTSGSGTNTLTFNYTVTAGDLSSDLDYVATNSLSTGTITSASGIVILTLPAPGAPGSLGANKDIVIDNGIAPSVTSFVRQTPSSGSTNADSLVFRVTFSEAMANVDVSDFVVTGTTATPTLLTAVSADVYDITVAGGNLPNLNGTVGLDLSQTQDIEDATGNPLPTVEPSVDHTYRVDNLGPTVTVNEDSSQPDPAAVLPISFRVVFSEPIIASTFAVDDISQTGTATGITWTITESSNGANTDFTLRATAVTGAGTLVPSIAVSRVTDAAGNPNAASTSTDNSVTYTIIPTLTNIVISEFRTTGPGGASDEFVEIYNPTTNPVDISGWILSGSNSSGNTDNRATIPAATLLRSGQYFLIAHNNYTGTVSPNLRYGTSISNDGGIALINSAGDIVDEVGMHQDSFYQEGTTLSPLSGTTNRSYERKNGGTSDSCVDTNDNASDFLDANSNTIHNYASPLSLCGTPRSTPSATTTLITGDTPDPSLSNGNVSVSVRVTGGATTPTGRVSISGANTNCTINLNTSGTGSCTVKFTSNGTKTITATYLGDNTHASSSDTESHQVGATFVRTPTRTPTPPPPPPLIAINEFVPRPGHDWNGDGVVNVGDEFIELINHGVIDVNLSGYTLDDEVNIGSTPFRLPSITMRPGERRVFYGSETNLLLSDGGDGVRLIRPNGQLGDAFNYRVVRFPDQSYCRLPDNGGLDDWNQNCFPTPGLQNSIGSTVNPPASGDPNNLCPIADTLPNDFMLAECPPFGVNIWNPAYWDRTGWYGERFLPESPGKWNVFVD